MSRYLTGGQVKRIRELRADGFSGRRVAELVGVCVTTVYKIAPGRVGKVPVAPTREAFLRSGLPASEVARRLGWHSGHATDASRVLRTLGLRDTANGSGVRTRRTVADAEVVGQIAEAIGLMPWEVMPDEDAAA